MTRIRSRAGTVGGSRPGRDIRFWPECELRRVSEKVSLSRWTGKSLAPGQTDANEPPGHRKSAIVNRLSRGWDGTEPMGIADLVDQI
jgi:hypothetical protein